MSIDAIAARRVARAELMKRVLIVVTAVLVAIVLLQQARLLGAIRDTQQTGSPTLRAISEQQDDIEAAARASVATNELLLGCFDPESECAKRNAAQAAEQAGAYNAAVIAAQFCVDQRLPEDYTLHELTVCVGELIEKRKDQP